MAEVASEAPTGARRRAGVPAWLKAAAREPLVHFLAIGLVLVLGVQAAHWLQRPVVRIDARELDQLVAYWELQSQRPPNPAELRAILQERIDEELLAREARRLGLDRDDLIVRRRLAQKMAFATEDLAGAAAPDEAALVAYYQAHPSRYAAPAQVALRQIYFSGDRPAAHAEAAARAALAQARAGRDQGLGDPFLLPLTYADVSLEDLEKDYGAAFAEAVRTAPTGAWIGPVASPFGLHLIRVEAREAEALKPFDEVREEVRSAVIAERRRANNARYLESLRRRYRIEVADPAP